MDFARYLVGEGGFEPPAPACKRRTESWPRAQARTLGFQLVPVTEQSVSQKALMGGSAGFMSAGSSPCCFLSKDSNLHPSDGAQSRQCALEEQNIDSVGVDQLLARGPGDDRKAAILRGVHDTRMILHGAQGSDRLSLRLVRP